MRGSDDTVVAVTGTSSRLSTARLRDVSGFLGIRAERTKAVRLVALSCVGRVTGIQLP
jgi:hypothetical protein